MALKFNPYASDVEDLAAISQIHSTVKRPEAPGRATAQHITRLRDRLRQAMAMANRAEVEWQKRTGELEKLNPDPADQLIASARDVPLAAALAAHSWWSREAEKYAAAISAEIAASEFLGERLVNVRVVED